MIFRPPPSARPLYHTGQELYVQREVRELPRGAKVKIRRWMLLGREFRYEVDYEHERHWCYEYDLGLQSIF